MGTFYSWRRKHQGRTTSGVLVGEDSGEELQKSDGEWLALPVGGLNRHEAGWDVELELGDGITLRLSRR